jgi:class 3 adenylate cyclase/tetratricopeptide (TPR) repeat protein
VIERLAAYVAADRLHALAAGRDLADRATGSALSADLAGFTGLTEALARRLGPREGPEELTRQLNAVYDGLVAEVGALGGSVVGFAGDGFTAWFDDGRGPAAPRAAACGLALQERFAAWAAAEEGRSALALRVAVASGPVRRFAVGDPAVHRVDTLAGETMARLAAADAAARPGEVVVDEATAAGLGRLLEAGEARPDEAGRLVVAVRGLAHAVSGAPWAAGGGGLTVEGLRPWVLPPVFERLAAGQADFMTELRAVGVLFLGFEGIDYDGDAEAGAALDAFVRRVQSVLARYDGSLLQLTIGDKGSYLYACLGAPVSHEDDALRAVRAALRLSRIADSPVRAVRIGVSHGTARVGAYGGGRRRTYGALGDEVNLAARLMQKAKAGEPLFSARVRQATESAVRWEPLPALLVKGRDEPVPVFRAVGATEAAPPRALPLVGREDERKALARAVEAAVAGDGAVLLLEGEAGLGKSRLLEDLVERAEASGLRVLAGAGDAIERHQPYHGWRPVFEQLLEVGTRALRHGRRAASATIALGRTQARLVPGPARRRPELAEDDAARVRARVAAAGPGLEGLAPLVNAVLTRELPETDQTRGLAPLARAARTLDLLVALLRRAAEETPLVVVLEDAHCFDSASWALALRAAGTRGLVLAVAARPLGADAPKEHALLRGRDATWTLPLGPLGEEAVDAIAAAALGASRLAGPLAAAVRERAEGSPLVALEVARALGEGGLVELADGEARPTSVAAASGALALPATVEGLVLGRIDRLPPVAQRVLKVGAVIGRTFGWSALSQVLQPSDGAVAGSRELAPALRQLEQAGLVEAFRDGPEPAWGFRSALVQDVVYNLMTSDQRRELHRAVAERLEGGASALEPTELAVLAHHWVRAGRILRAQPYLERAAEATLRAGAWAEAARLYGMLVHSEEGLSSDAPGRLRQAGWRSQLGAAEAGAGRIREARRQVETALALLGQRIGGSVVRAAFGAGARDVVRRVAPFLLKGSGDVALAEATRAYERLAELYYLSEAPVDAFREALRGLELALLTGQEGVRTRLQAAVSLALSVVPARRLAGPLIADAVAGARATGEPDTVGWVLQLAALQAFAVGRWSETAETLDEAFSLSERAGDRRRALELRTLRAWALLTRGDLRAAGPLLAALERDAASEGDLRSRAAAGTGLAVVALRQGEVEKGMSLVRGRRAPALLPFAHALRGEAREALASLPEAVAQGRARPVKCWGLERFALPAEAALRLRESEAELGPEERARLATLAREAVAACARFARVFPIGEPRAALLAGTAAWLDGREGKARAAWSRALAAARRLDMPYDEARARLELARRGVSRDRAGHLDRAASLLGELGALDDRQAVERERPI